MHRHSRRKLLFGTGSAVFGGFAGCNSVGGPNPNVLETSTEIIGPEPTDVLIRVIVENTGSSGDVRVTVTTFNENDNEIEFFGRVVTIESDTERQLAFDVVLITNAESIRAEAEPA
jgi:hypothetical protein